MKRTLVFLALSVLLSASAHAALTLNVTTFTADELTLSISGTFDTDVGGDQQFWLAINRDWVNTEGSNFDWIADSLDFGAISATPGLTVIEDSITFNGAAPTASVVAASGQNWGDSIYWQSSSEILAGTTVTGSLSVTGIDIFDPTAGNFQLVSGLDLADATWNRLESAPVPIPAGVWLLGSAIGLLG